MRISSLLAAVAALALSPVATGTAVPCFQPAYRSRHILGADVPSRRHGSFLHRVSSSIGPSAPLSMSSKQDGEAIDLKAELTAYLKVREERNADEEAKKQVGKVVGGTKGNAVLDYVSGAPAKEQVVEEAPNVFDYEELIKYGFKHLVTPIMDAGGRLEMYQLMDMTPPPPSERLKPKSAPELVIDRTGESDKARYTGLKMGQVLDDDEMGRRLQEAYKKEKEGKRLRPELAEEQYIQPFADKRNVGAKLAPDWTAEQIDEQTRRTGEAIAWAKKAKEGAFRKDPAEVLAVEGGLQVYCCVAVLFVSFAFGRASPAALSLLGFQEASAQSLLDTLQAPALALVIAAIGSSLVSSILLAPGKNRNSFVWAIKGLAGGPLTVLQLRGLDPLVTNAEADAANE